MSRRRVCGLLWSACLVVFSAGCVGTKPSVDAKGSQPVSVERNAPRVEPAPKDAGAVLFQTAAGPVRVVVEIAATPETRRKGLMGRAELAEGAGMLFVFDARAVQTFWMRNTLISLDMIFVDGPPSGQGASVVGLVERAEPHSTELRSVPQPSRFVVEVPGGWARAQGIVPGTSVRFID